ncbi:hypothetical protein LshimejAT787_1303370 [Lyophyllum shimeji]|uniref:Uncharacterized protein n=1 Tax=Lyophyllum shimeji TaxID=47721 RepID=A0A9P3UUS3_LYOSH|nr:hypothetical protein LshimejAT787_1303370 [Lyophyllum shimeji]
MRRFAANRDFEAFKFKFEDDILARRVTQLHGSPPPGPPVEAQQQMLHFRTRFQVDRAVDVSQLIMPSLAVAVVQHDNMLSPVLAPETLCLLA